MSAPALVYLALGSNLGERAANLRAAWASLPPQVRPLRASPIYQTQPWGFTEQPEFLNQVFEVQTTLAPLELLSHLHSIETLLGRIPTFRNGPRLIDIDILFYANLQLSLPDLMIPHPRLHERAFVLIPLCDLVPDLVHPVLGQTIRQLAAQVDPAGMEVYHE